MVAVQPYTQGVIESSAGASALIGESLPSYISVPPVRVSRDNLAEAYEKITASRFRKRCDVQSEEALHNAVQG